MANLRDAFGTVNDLLELEIEELAGVLLPHLPDNDNFCVATLHHELFEGGRFPHGSRGDVEMALNEALSWLESQALAMHDPGQRHTWMRLTRRGRKVRTSEEFQLFQLGQILPVHLIQERLVAKVRPLFMRGDHDTAVFQAFKEVEVAVRTACGFGNEVIGKTLMVRAFNAENGPLADASLVTAEREAEMSLFVGAIGHAKNPASHRDVELTPLEAARLIVFAAHLLSIVEARATSTA
jgi:uncharacterized protein (TIGR02391 family)